jgi:hypothetical protein
MMENVIDKLIKEVQQYSLQDIHIIAEQNRKRMQAIIVASEINEIFLQDKITNAIIQGSSR